MCLILCRVHFYLPKIKNQFKEKGGQNEKKIKGYTIDDDCITTIT